jgi:ketosteroid isomerase-like protein
MISSRTSRGLRTRLKYVSEDGDWKLDQFGAPIRDKSSEAAEGTSKPKIMRGLDARATVDAYYQAIEDGDGAALCGLLSRRYALEIREGPKTSTPITACVEGLRNYDWSEPRRRNKGVRIVDVSRSGDTVRVTLSTGNRAVLKRHDDRWVIDDIEVKS